MPNTPARLNVETRWAIVAAVAFMASLVLWITAIPQLQAQTFTILVSWGRGPGGNPFGQPVVDKGGTIRGTTATGGDYGYGTVWILDNRGVMVIMHHFTNSDGAHPDGIVLDRAGKTFGTTSKGGSSGGGTLFRIKAPGDTFTTLHNFGASGDGKTVYTGPALDPSDDSYGASDDGGAFGCGTVWKVTTHRIATILHSFNCGSDGGHPYVGSLHRDERGNFYGVATSGGADKCGTLFEITLTGTFGVLHNFRGSTEGCSPTGAIAEYNGSLYGTSETGGASRNGTVWRYTISGSSFAVLHSFSGADGSHPLGGVACQKTKQRGSCSANLFGTTKLGGPHNYGTVWEMSSTGEFVTLHNFAGDDDGAYPYSCPFVDTRGWLYGTAPYGGAGHGASGFGTLWQIRKLKTHRP